MIDKYTAFVVNHKKSISIIFGIISLICAVMILGVKVNYNLVDYLPLDAQSTKAVSIMSEEFTQSVPNLSVMVRDVNIPQALEIKEMLLEIPGVEQVLWLDDMMDTATVLEMQDQSTVEGFYKNNTALFSVSVSQGYESSAVEEIRELIGEENAVSGEAADLDSMRQATSNETLKAVALLVPIIIGILVISSSSWIEPLLFLLAIGVSILINMGTNIFLGQVSFVTFSVSPILQLAVSLDYAIFLLHRFRDNRNDYENVNEAMRAAIKSSLTTIAASASTTLFGFIALMFMGFRIGADLGLNLAKGIVLSFISCVLFLPAVTLWLYKFIDKTSHRPFLPNFQNVNKVFRKLKYPILVLVIIITIPAFLGQRQTKFIYGNVDGSPDSRSSIESKAIKDEFGQSAIMALLVPRGNIAKELMLSEELESLTNVTTVMSFASTVGTGIPVEFLPSYVADQFYSENFSRIIIYTNTENEGEEAFGLVERVYEVTDGYYDDYYCAGQSANLYDMAAVVSVDNRRVNLIAVIAIFFVLLVSLKSLVLPLILLFTIEIGIWINLSIPYFAGTPINFIGYLILSTVQLGATVDYAILLTGNYLSFRRELSQGEAIHQAMGQSFQSILVSGGVLAAAGFILAGTTTNPMIGDIGTLLGRGALLSMVTVLCLLPALLQVFDKPIGRLTYKSGFYKKPKDENTQKEVSMSHE